jgi:putative aldouronate transport system substrate-binding protein
MKKSIFLMSLAIILVAVLAACDTAGQTGGTTEQAVPAAQGNGGGGGNGNFQFAGYPMDAEDVNVTFWLWGGPQLHASVSNWQDSPFHSGLNEQVGVNIEWMFPPAGAADESQEFNLIIASGNFPDIMFSGLIMRDAERLIDEGVFRDLTPYMERYAPNYFAFLQEDPVRDRAFKTDSGRYFGFGFFREDGGWNDTYTGPLVRQDWLDELGLPAPVTISDWDRTLRAFNSEFGATFISSWNRFGYTGNIAGAFGAFGGVQYRRFIDRNDGQVKLAQVLPEWRYYAQQMSTWWNDGLIDQDIMSADDAMVRSKVLNNESGLAFSSMGQLSGWVNDAIAENTGSNWVGLNYPRGDDGAQAFVFGGPGIGGTSTSITTNVGDDRLEIVMRLLDFAYSPEGFMYWNFGTEGVSYNIVDGRPIFSDLLHNDPDGIHGAMERFVGSVWNGPTIQATEVLIQRNNPAAIEANNTWFFGNEHLSRDFPLPRGMALSAAEMSRAEILEGPIETYVNEMTVRFITGAEPIENFDAFVATVEGMGLEELLSLYQTAYERWLAR